MNCKALVMAGLALAVTLWAPLALACPYCAAQDDGGMASLYVIGAMMLFPFAVVAVVIPLVRRAGARAATFSPDPSLGGES